MTIEYTKVGDYYFPNIKGRQQIQLSKYGRMKLQHLKNHQQGLYHKLLAGNELNDYLIMVDREVSELHDKLIVDFKRNRNITEELKEQNQIQWIKEMNNIQNCIDEIIRKNVIEI